MTQFIPSRVESAIARTGGKADSMELSIRCEPDTFPLRVRAVTET